MNGVILKEPYPKGHKDEELVYDSIKSDDFRTSAKSSLLISHLPRLAPEEYFRIEGIITFGTPSNKDIALVPNDASAGVFSLNQTGINTANSDLRSYSSALNTFYLMAGIGSVTTTRTVQFESKLYPSATKRILRSKTEIEYSAANHIGDASTSSYWHDDSTVLTSLTLQLDGSAQFTGWIRIYKVKKG